MDKIINSPNIYKVLIVDDEMLIRQGIKHYIDWQKEGFVIVGEASNGQEAIDMIEKYRPHLVITDIVMPVMDGEHLIKIIKHTYPEIEVIVLSSFSDFKYVRSSFKSGVSDYVLKTNLESQELLTVINKIKNKFPQLNQSNADNNFETKDIDLLIDRALSGFEIIENYLILEAFPNDTFSIIGILNQEQESSLQQFNTVLDKVFEELLHISHFKILSKKPNGITILVNFNHNQESSIVKLLNESLKAKAKPSSLKWIMSKPFNQFNDIKKNLEEDFAKLKKSLFYLSNRPYLLYKDKLPEINDLSINFDLNYFINIFKLNEIDQAFDYLNDYVVSLSHCYNRDEMELKSFLGNIIFNIIVLLRNMNYEVDELEEDKYNYFTKINESLTAKEAGLHFKVFIDQVRIAINDKTAQETNIKNLLAFIDKHYAEQLTLTDVANHFHFNPSYFSSYFSTHHSEGFSEYLNRVRIYKSIELLENSKISISIISGMVGYSEHSYYCKVFKKMMGMSPSSYRRKHSSKD